MNIIITTGEGGTRIIKMDKMLATIIIFIVLMFTTAAILMTAVVPKIFQTGQQINQTQETLNQTQLFLQQAKHEDEARINQTAHEDEARDKQRIEIVKDTNKSLNVLQSNVTGFIRESLERSEQANKERSLIQTEIHDLQKKLNSTMDILVKMTHDHERESTTHRNESANHHQKMMEYLDKIDKKVP